MLFATIIIALAVYQATVVPAQNADVEYKHSQQVQDDLVQLRNSVLGTASAGDARPVSVTLGTTYPSRVFSINPPSPAGRLATETYADGTIRVSNVAATNAETRDYLNGTWTATTKYISYTPGYNEFQTAPTTRYTATLLADYYADEGRRCCRPIRCWFAGTRSRWCRWLGRWTPRRPGRWLSARRP